MNYVILVYFLQLDFLMFNIFFVKYMYGYTVVLPIREEYIAPGDSWNQG